MCAYNMSFKTNVCRSFLIERISGSFRGESVKAKTYSQSYLKKTLYKCVYLYNGTNFIIINSDCVFVLRLY